MKGNRKNTAAAEETIQTCSAGRYSSGTGKIGKVIYARVQITGYFKGVLNIDSLENYTGFVFAGIISAV